MLDKKQLTVRLPQSTVDYLSQKLWTADKQLVNSVTENNSDPEAFVINLTCSRNGLLLI